MCVCGCETEGRDSQEEEHIRVSLCESEWIGQRRNALAVTEVLGVRGWEFLTLDDSTASCGVFQHLNNFPFHHLFPFFLFGFFFKSLFRFPPLAELSEKRGTDFFRWEIAQRWSLPKKTPAQASSFHIFPWEFTYSSSLNTMRNRKHLRVVVLVNIFSIRGHLKPVRLIATSSRTLPSLLPKTISKTFDIFTIPRIIIAKGFFCFYCYRSSSLRRPMIIIEYKKSHLFLIKYFFLSIRIEDIFFLFFGGHFPTSTAMIRHGCSHWNERALLHYFRRVAGLSTKWSSCAMGNFRKAPSRIREA